MVTGDARWSLFHFWNARSHNLLDVPALCPGGEPSRVSVHALLWGSITLFANGRSWWEDCAHVCPRCPSEWFLYCMCTRVVAHKVLNET